MMFNKFIEIMSQEREFILKAAFVFSFFAGLATALLRIFYVPPELKEFLIIREYVISFMMVYCLNEWAKLHDSEGSEKK